MMSSHPSKSFRALVVHDDPLKQEICAFATLGDLPKVKGVEKYNGMKQCTVNVAFSTINFKDGMVLNGMKGVATSFPIVPGIDFAGTVEEDESGIFAPGENVVLTGKYAGQHMNGGFSEKVKVPSEWLIRLPERFSMQQSMVIATAGFTAMQSIVWLERSFAANNREPPKDAPILVTGASGGVGSTAVAILKNLGFSNVIASSSRADENRDWLKRIGAAEVISRIEAGKPMEKEQFLAAIDTVGGATTAGVLAKMKCNGVVTACGVAAGPKVPASVFPFILRGVSLIGVDSVQLENPDRAEIWERLAKDFPESYFQDIQTYKLEDLPDLAAKIIKGQVKGRAVIEISKL